MGYVVDAADLVLDHVRTPIAFSPGTEQVVMSDRARPHDLSMGFIVVRIRQGARSEVDEGSQTGFAQPVGQVHLGDSGEVTLKDVGGDIRYTTGGLECRQGIGEFRVKDGEFRKEQREPAGRLCWPSALVITLLSLDSLPAAAMVRITPTGRAAWGLPFSV